MRLLVVEDDSILRDGMVRSLELGGYIVDSAADGLAAEHFLAVQQFDLLILDLGLPKKDGLSVLRKFRGHNQATPVMIITARDAVSDRVTGLDLGGDDYLTKPFDLAEFEARVRALVRRGQGTYSNQIVIGPLRLDLNARNAYLADNLLELSPRELSVLEVLMLRAGQVVSKAQLAEKFSSWSDEIGPNAIEVYVHRLRKKLEPSQITIRTIRGLGYLMEK